MFSYLRLVGLSCSNLQESKVAKILANCDNPCNWSSPRKMGVARFGFFSPAMRSSDTYAARYVDDKRKCTMLWGKFKSVTHSFSSCACNVGIISLILTQSGADVTTRYAMGCPQSIFLVI